jgi:hypothetical protein
LKKKIRLFTGISSRCFTCTQKGKKKDPQLRAF